MFALVNLWIFLCLVPGWLALAACGSGSGEAHSTNPAYDRLLRVLYRRTVPVVPAAGLAHELALPVPPILLDVRTPAEYRVSHLAGARFVNFDAVATQEFAGLDRNRAVVVYCSVGYRSERLG